MAALVGRVTAWALAALFLFPAVPGLAAPPATAAFDPDQALADSQAALGRTLSGYEFRDPSLRRFTLSEFRGRPLLINLVYTSCAFGCPLVIETLADSIDVAREAVGRDSFQVLTIGFDTRMDTPERMREFAANHGIRDDGWRFASADSETIGRLSKDLGFLFFPSAKGFDHLTQTTVVDADGVIYRQVYGAMFDAPFLVEPLKDLVFGRQSVPTSYEGLLNRIRLFCTIYDPWSGRYRFDYSPFIGIAVGVTLLGTLGFFVARGWLRHRRPRPRT
ncbi:MAG: SCO family protein [Rhodospirillales bacterium]|nr:SCO family protein [Rhodospirillales bacterium]